MKSTLFKMFVFSMAIMVGSSSFVFADDAALLSRITNLENMMSQMQGTINSQNAKISTLQGDSPAKSYGYIRDEGADQTAYADLNGDYKWLKDLKWAGDFRLRYEAQSEHSAFNTPDRNRFRYRLRYGLTKTFHGGPIHEDDKTEVGFRLASAPVGARDSTNTTLDTQFTFKDISIDRAYAKYFPAWAKWEGDNGLSVGVDNITAGKFDNPFTQGSTWGIWDGDVTPEGIYEQINFNLLKSDDLDLGGKFIMGQLILEEGAGVNHDDAELYAYQVILESKIKAFSENPIKMKNAFSYYNFSDFGLPGNFGAAGNNTLSATAAGTLATSFSVVDIYNELVFPFELHKAKGLKLYFDFFKNVAGNGLDVEKGGDDYAWMIGAKLGSAKKKGEWQIGYDYAWIEANASPDVFNDSDFGGTDRRGSVIKADYMLTDTLSIGGAAFYTDRINAGDTGVVSAQRSLYQIDLVWKF